MVTLAQRIEELRTEAGYSRAGLASALGLPKGAFDKFETGRATPTKEQQAQIAGFFNVSLFYLRGESSDRTRQEDWMDLAAAEEGPGFVPAPAPKARRAPAEESGQGASLLDALLTGKQAKETLRALVVEVLHTPEGQAAVAKAVQKELARRGL